MYKVLFIVGMSAIPRARFIYGAPTREMATDLLWDPLKETCERLDIEADFKEIGKTCTFRRTGARLKLVGLDDRREMGKQRGQPFDGVGLDEIVEFPPELIEWFVDRIVGPRLGERSGWIGLASTPGHLLRGRFYEATRDGSALHVPYAELDKHPGWGGWVSFAWSLRQVIELPNAARLYPAIVANWIEALRVKAQNQWGDDNPIWLREYEGRWAADDTLLVYRYRPHVDGKPWNEWDPPRRDGQYRLAELPDTFKDWLYVVAIDEGYSDPFACNVFAFSPSDTSMTIYHVYGMEQGPRRQKDENATPGPVEEKMYARPVALMMLGEGLTPAKPGGLIGALGQWPVGMEADAGEALVLELARVYGLRFERFDRTRNYKITAIEVVNGDLRDGRIKILKGSPLAKQLGELQWAVDSYGNQIENKAQANHSTDCLLVARRVISRLITAGTVTQATPTAPMQIPPSADSEDRFVPDVKGEFAGMLVSGDYSDPWNLP